MIFQMHPDHGRHLALTDNEADANVKNGWKTVTKEEFYGKPVEKPVELKVVDNSDREELIAQYIEKFGDKPHHRTSNDTIQAKLNE